MSQPDICLYDAGVDPHEEDALGRLCLSTNGLFRRDKMVRPDVTLYWESIDF